jgi:hypothetical protein
MAGAASVIRRMPVLQRSGLLLLNTFVAADTTPLTSYTPVINKPGTAWTHRNGSYTISSNTAVGANGTASPYNIATLGTGKAEGLIVCTLNRQQDQGVIVRYKPADGTFMLVAIVGGYLRMYEYSPGFVLRAQSSVGSLPNGLHEIHVNLLGATISAVTFWSAGQASASYAGFSNNAACTDHGIYAYNNSGCVYDWRMY